jgi:hypothetical protein
MANLNPVVLPRYSERTGSFRLSLNRYLVGASIVSEPLRSRLRNRALARATSLQHDETLDGTTPLLVLMVYRARNVRLVKALLSQFESTADIRLWALDEIVPELASKTLGCGLGVRFSHINWLYNVEPVKEGSWLVIADDDFFFSKGNITSTITMMKRAGFSLAQPSQSMMGWWSDLFHVSRPLVQARDTNCVEQGPLFIADSEFLKIILPLPESNDMGWGIEAEWYQLNEGRLRIGIIDGCRVVHCGKVANSYAVGPALETMRKRVLDSGIESFWQLRSVNKYWFTWQRTPPWATD